MHDLEQARQWIRALPIVWRVCDHQSDPNSEMQDVEPNYEAMYHAAMAVLFSDDENA